MSEDNAISELQQRLKETAELEKEKQEVARLKAIADKRFYADKVQKIEEGDKEIEIIKNLDFGTMTDEQVQKIQEQNEAYFEAARHNMKFITEEFGGVVPFFMRNLILIGAKTGAGKSTAVTNIIASVLKQIDPETGKPCKVLHITNEEAAGDAYNKLTCLSRGWNYINHSEFTDEQKVTFQKALPLWARHLTIVDNDYCGGRDVTTSIEGIQGIFNDILEKGHKYNLITIDFYQFVSECKSRPGMELKDVLTKLSAMLKKYMNILRCPIVIFAQLHPDGNDTDIFEKKIKGSKSILIPSTVALEMVVDYENRITTWEVIKNRFNGASIGKKITTGYDKGKFVPATTAFREQVQRENYERTARETARQMDQNNGLPGVFKDQNGPKS